MADKRNYTSKTLLDVKFKPNVKGYDSDQVDKVLDEIIADYSSYEKFVLEAKDYISNLETRIGKLDEAIKQKDIELAKLNNRAEAIKGATGVTSENIEHIRRIRALEKALYSLGGDPSKIK